EPQQSRDHTERILCRARVPFERDGLTLRVSPVDELELDDVVVPGDPSSGAFLAAAACVVPGSRVLLDGVALNWTRTGFFRIAERMGAVIVGDLEDPSNPSATEEPVGELDIAQAPLEGTTVEPAEVPLAIDELPLVALLGCFAEGETVVRGAEELRVKESDRIAGVVDGLRALGADIDATPDGFAVGGGGGLDGGELDSRGDHRMAMLGAIAGLASGCDFYRLDVKTPSGFYKNFLGGVRVNLTNFGPYDLDLAIYNRNPDGTRGEPVTGSTNGPGTPETATIDAAQGSYWVVVVNYLAPNGQTYDASATFTGHPPKPTLAVLNRRIGAGPANSRASHDRYTSHSEPSIAMDPLNHRHLIAGSKMYQNNAEYLFKAGTYESFDGGRHWKDWGQLPGYCTQP